MNEMQQESKDNASNPFSGLKTGIKPDDVKQREGWRDRNGNVHYVDYVEWHTVADVLDREKPDWSHAVKEMREIGDIFTVIVAITIDGITREGIGTGAAGTELGIKKAKHDALKRAAVKFGVGRDLYKKESDLIERQGAVRQFDRESAAPSNPVARSTADLLTGKQIGMLHALAREKSLDLNVVCESLWAGVKFDELSKKAASYLIEHLQVGESDAPEVRTGIPAAPPSSPAALAIVKPENTAAGTSPAMSDSFERLRAEIIEKFAEVGQSAEPSLASFDRERETVRKKEVHAGIMNFIVQTKRKQIQQSMMESNWNPNEIEGELAKFGITELHRATVEQISRMWADFRQAKQL